MWALHFVSIWLNVASGGIHRLVMVIIPEGFMALDLKVFYVENGCWCIVSHVGKIFLNWWIRNTDTSSATSCILFLEQDFLQTLCRDILPESRCLPQFPMHSILRA